MFLSEALLNSAVPLHSTEHQTETAGVAPSINNNNNNNSNNNDNSSNSNATTINAKGKGRARDSIGNGVETRDQETSFNGIRLPVISQKSLFLALYAKFMAGEKRRSEETEMVMGPHDLGTVLNQQLVVVGRLLAAWFGPRTDENGDVQNSQGWLEYL